MKVKHWNKKLLESLNSIFAENSRGGKVLDLGAGDGKSINLFPSDWEWTGVDIESENDNVQIGDAHKLDFTDNHFDLVVSIAVFEHLHSPWIAIKEISRVLKKGGYFLGTVAFLEPEHQNSYFHMTERGMSKIIEEGNLSLEFIEPVKGWNVGTSMKILPLPGMRFYNRIRSGLVFALRSLLINIRIATLSGVRKERAINFKKTDKSRYAGSFSFMAKKV